jgi:hypothetical protein
LYLIVYRHEQCQSQSHLEQFIKEIPCTT